MAEEKISRGSIWRHISHVLRDLGATDPDKAITPERLLAEVRKRATKAVDETDFRRELGSARSKGKLGIVDRGAKVYRKTRS